MKKIFVGVLVLGLLAGGVWFGRPAYKNWVARRSLAQAQDHWAKREYREASLCARKVLAVRPANVEATRMMAHLAEMANAPAAIKWWQRVVELEPKALQNRLDLARVAVALKNISAAREALDGVAEADRNTSAFHETSAMVAITAGHLGEAEHHFTEAIRLNPENSAMRLNLAVLQSQSTNAQVAQTAQQTLEELVNDKKVRRNALRQLTLMAQQKNDLASAQKYAQQLQADPEAPFEDRVLYLTVLTKSKAAAATNYLATLQQEAEKRPDQIFTLASWMLGQEQAKAALEWLNQLPEPTKQQQPVMMARADCYSALEDWVALQELLKDQKWESLEFMRLAILAKAANEQGHELAARSQWKQAVAEARPSLKALQTLLRMATAWKWDDDREDLLWTIAQYFPAERWALAELEKWYYTQGNTRGLQKVYTEQASFNLKDLAAKNNLATTSMLLKTQLSQAYDMAQQVYAAAPDQPAFVSTYAYAQHLQGKTEDGLKALEKLKPQILENPAVAVYYGTLLVAAGNTNQAKKYLEIAQKGRLLPEEKALVQNALKGN